MAPRYSGSSPFFMPFLYPSVFLSRAGSVSRSWSGPFLSNTTPSRHDEPMAQSHLNPSPDDYAAPYFADKARLSIHAGPGGNGCISFLREAYMPDGPPKGGDGGHGGNVYIQAAHGETSLHKLDRRRFVRAGPGKNGQGSARGGQRGEDVV